MFQVLSILLTLTLFFGCTNSSTTESGNETVKTDSSSEAMPIDGAWELVWAKYNDTVADVTKNPQFKMFHQGKFSLIARDSSKKISFAGFGKYELDGKVYKETFLYADSPEYTGGMDWQEYEWRGDTLYFKGFNKVIVGGKEVTSDFPKIEEKRVRIK